MRAELAAAMARRDREATSALRVALAALANAEAIPVASAGEATEADRRELSDAERRAIVLGVIADHPETAEVLQPFL